MKYLKDLNNGHNMANMANMRSAHHGNAHKTFGRYSTRSAELINCNLHTCCIPLVESTMPPP